MSSIKYNIVSNEGEASSVTVFIGSEMFVATADHPNFRRILETVRTQVPGGMTAGEQGIRDLFDVSVAVGTKFARLSERVLAKSGKLYFDGVEMHTALSDVIVKFHAGGLDDFASLVAFMEKIEINPSPHSREHLFRWLTKHDFTICPDGDFLAYKGVNADDKSVSRGEAIVNNEVVNGRITNVSGTVIEMPRDKVQFDPAVGCSTGLHAGNWRYASNFANKVLRVKINPRDVVSVPVDSNDEKLRVCRYRVLDVVTREDKSMLYLGDLDRRTRQMRPAEKKEANIPEAIDPSPAKEPEYYEQCKKADFRAMPYNELRWLAKEWEVKVGSNPAKDRLVDGLVKEARKRLKTWDT